MHLHLETTTTARSDCSILSLSWMGKVPDDMPEDEGWKLNRVQYYQEGWLATGNARGIVGVTYTTSHSKRSADLPPRTNYNLRGHRAEVTLVKWNEPYQKLATCDSSGIIFVWIKYEGRWSIELINDRNTPVTHFCWSHDGRMALICYQDGFVLVGSVAGQRYWSSMLNLQSAITAGVFTPDDQQVYFGTTSGLVIVMDVHGAMVSQVPLLDDTAITALAWSCPKFKMEENEEAYHRSARDAELGWLLAVVFQTGLVYLVRSYDDVSPVVIRTGLRGVLVEWTNSGELLAVAGHLPDEGCTVGSTAHHPVRNVIKFYTRHGNLRYTHRLPASQTPVTALTWGHNDKRVFIATGAQVHIGRVSRRIASLQLLCRLNIKAQVRDEDDVCKLPLPRRLRALVTALYTQTIRFYIPEAQEVREFVSRPPHNAQRLHCTMIRHDDDLIPTPGACYTLYLEYLGGLVPLLKGKRTSKIRPEFVIFDPQAEQDLNRESNGERSGGGGIGGGGCGNGGGGNGGGVSAHLSNGHALSDTSDTEYEDVCASPRLQRRRKLKRRIRERLESESDELVYLDTLPEQHRLVEVTSNIWGTKFKLHGVASSLPANLGQVTYKTSLLHLQPRQMTLVITELREDILPRPDPSFNPNVFSEDEEDLSDRVVTRPTAPSDLPTDVPPIAPMTPRRTPSAYSRHGSNSNAPWEARRPTPSGPGHGHARPSPAPDEGISYSYVGGTEACGQRRPEAPARLGVSELRAELPRTGSDAEDAHYVDLGTPELLQGRDGLLGGGDSGPDSPVFASRMRGSAPTSPKHSVSPFCCDAGSLQSSKNIVAPSSVLKRKGTSGLLELQGANGEAGVGGSGTVGGGKGRGEELRLYGPTHSVHAGSCSPLHSSCNHTNNNSSSSTELLSSDTYNSHPHQHTQLPPSSVPLTSSSAASTNSCSSGGSSHRSPQHLQRCLGGMCGRRRTPRLQEWGKSRSLDSSPLFVNRRHHFNSENSPPPPLPPQPLPQPPLLQRNLLLLQHSQHLHQKHDNNSPKTIKESVLVERLTALQRESSAPQPPPTPKHLPTTPESTRRLYTPTHTPAHSPSPNLSPAHTSKSIPSTPVKTRKARRHQSSSPIRKHLLNSPLLSRRRQRRSTVESSDDEVVHCSSDAEILCSSSNYRDLETFQKTQLRNKLRRSRGRPETDAPTPAPRHRQFMMHNKAPLWNENSQVYQLDFGGRVTQESAKNFQIEFKGKQVMQFGRIDGNAYTLDFQYPFSAVQAFAVALANVTQRLK